MFRRRIFLPIEDFLLGRTVVVRRSNRNNGNNGNNGNNHR
jgi:hypothetical protein